MLRRFRLLVAVLISVSIMTVGCREARQTGEGELQLDPLTLSIVTWPGFGPAFVAQKKGFFEDEGIALEIEIQENVDAKRASLLAGQLDIVGITLETVVLERLQGLPVGFIGFSDISAGADGVIVSNEIQSIEELRGKKIAYPEGQPSHLFLLHVLEQASVPFDSIDPVLTEDAGRAGEFFAAGRVDAAVTWEPWLSTAVDRQEGGRVIIRSTGQEPILIGGFEVNTNQLDEQMISRLARFLRAWYRGLDYLEGHTEEALGIMANGFGLPEAELSDMLQGLRFIPATEAHDLMGIDPGPADIEAAIHYEADLWVRAGVIEPAANVDVTGAYDPRPLAEAFAGAE